MINKMEPKPGFVSQNLWLINKNWSKNLKSKFNYLKPLFVQYFDIKICKIITKKLRSNNLYWMKWNYNK